MYVGNFSGILQGNTRARRSEFCNNKRRTNIEELTRCANRRRQRFIAQLPLNLRGSGGLLFAKRVLYMRAYIE